MHRTEIAMLGCLGQCSFKPGGRAKGFVKAFGNKNVNFVLTDEQGKYLRGLFLSRKSQIAKKFGIRFFIKTIMDDAIETRAGSSWFLRNTVNLKNSIGEQVNTDDMFEGK